MRICFSINPSSIGINTAHEATKRSANTQPSALNGDKNVKSCKKSKSVRTANALSASAARLSTSDDIARKYEGNSANGNRNMKFLKRYLNALPMYFTAYCPLLRSARRSAAAARPRRGGANLPLRLHKTGRSAVIQFYYIIKKNLCKVFHFYFMLLFPIHTFHKAAQNGARRTGAPLREAGGRGVSGGPSCPPVPHRRVACTIAERTP